VADGCVLAFDYGEKFIGVAVGQTVTASASPLTTLRARTGRPDWALVASLVREWRPIRLLVGLPLNMDGTESDMCARAREFSDRLRDQTGIPVIMVDERLTTRASNQAEAERRGRSAKGGKRGDAVHAAAAALIAETWLGEQGTPRG
jgi:putative Holliday junction resolvase